jgi:Mrp family chromosome partitioning ATPase
MDNIKKKIFVLSGKGGVGKTTVAINLAFSFALLGKKTGLLDVDIHGPNVPKMLGLDNNTFKIVSNGENNLLTPIDYSDNLRVMSLGFLVDSKDSVIFRGPMKHNIISQFTNDVDFGDLDYLVVDFPPGTGDEQISAAQLLGKDSGAIIVSTPQKVSILDSVRTIDFCKKMNIPILGIVENMSGGIFGKDTIKDVAKENDISYLGSIDLDLHIANSSDNGVPFVKENDSNVTKSFKEIVKKIINNN